MEFSAWAATVGNGRQYFPPVVGITRWESAARDSVFADPDGDSAGPRDGTLSLLCEVSRLSHLAILHSLPHTVRHHGSIHPHSFPAALAECSIRYRNRRPYCGIPGCTSGIDFLSWTVPGRAVRGSAARYSARISGGLSFGS